ncbi:MAG TPA: glycoside hydrolase family 2 TIM barrel-domain containing protein, partial [Gemmatimonadaceae bacterium]|nr:glycoside hydrolase family 2 TIM barrel-domain containing protein [Gemmatimonadaceae bacterium]
MDALAVVNPVEPRAAPAARPTPSVPRPEYPRPMFVRDEWLNLNGVWEFAFDDESVGLRDGWFDGRVLDRRIVVPFPYQCQLSEVNDKAVHECVWYARTLVVPAEWLGRDLLLHFGAVDYRTTVWVNAQEVGHNSGGHVPFEFDIAPYLHSGENRIVVRVEDRQDADQPRGKQSVTGSPREIDYYCTTGIWQTVWLEPAPATRVNDLRITPIVEEETFEIEILLHASADAWTIEIEVSDGETVVARSVRETYRATARVKLKVPGAKLWSPETPHLYDLRITLLKGGLLVDSIRSYAGMRSVEVRNGRYLLNGRAIYLAMVLDQGYWPESYLAAPSDDALRADVEWIKRFGFNGARKHQKIEDPRWLYWCDKLGLLVWEEMPNARAWSPRAEERLLAEWERALHRDQNHPCIITWVPVNESMGFPGLSASHPGQYDFLERMVARTRRTIPNAPIIDNDGWEHTDVTDVCAIHDYTSTAENLRARYRETIAGGALPAHVWLSGKPLFMRGSSYRGQPIVLTEVGGYLIVPPQIPADQRDVLYAFYGSVGTHDELLG